VTYQHPITGHSMTVRDAVTGAEILAVRDGNRIVVSDDGVDIVHLTPASALLLARQLLDVIGPEETTTTTTEVTK